MLEVLKQALEAIDPQTDESRRRGVKVVRAEAAEALRKVIESYESPVTQRGTVLAAHTSNTLLRQQFVLNVWLDPGQRVILENKK
jgi:hypothetical protein